MLRERAGAELQFGLTRKLWKWKVNVLNTTESYITDGESGNCDVKLFYQREKERVWSVWQSGRWAVPSIGDRGGRAVRTPTRQHKKRAPEWPRLRGAVGAAPFLGKS